jgi:hypothetical protein
VPELLMVRLLIDVLTASEALPLTVAVGMLATVVPLRSGAIRR